MRDGLWRVDECDGVRDGVPLRVPVRVRDGVRVPDRDAVTVRAPLCVALAVRVPLRGGLAVGVPLNEAGDGVLDRVALGDADAVLELPARTTTWTEEGD